MFHCANCKSEIEKDSFFCDQCGKEIFLCEICRSPRSGEWCSEHGEGLTPARQYNATSAAVADVSSTTIPVTVTSLNDVVVPPVTTGLSTPELKLTNRNLGITINIKHDTILGRTTGPYSTSLSACTKISGRHLQFLYDEREGWMFKDIGSTNGTKYNKVAGMWHTIEKVIPNTLQKISGNDFFLIADIEFAVFIENKQTNATERI